MSSPCNRQSRIFAAKAPNRSATNLRNLSKMPERAASWDFFLQGQQDQQSPSIFCNCGVSQRDCGSRSILRPENAFPGANLLGSSL